MCFILKHIFITYHYILLRSFSFQTHFLQKTCNGKLGSHFTLNKTRYLLILIVHFSILTSTYWTSPLHKNGMNHFGYSESFSKTLLKRLSSEKARQAFLKKKNCLKCSYTVGHILGEHIAVCHISGEAILLSRQFSVGTAHSLPSRKNFYLFNGSFGSYLLFGSEKMKFHFLRSVAQQVFVICQLNLLIRYNIK